MDRIHQIEFQRIKKNIEIPRNHTTGTIKTQNPKDKTITWNKETSNDRTTWTSMKTRGEIRCSGKT